MKSCEEACLPSSILIYMYSYIIEDDERVQKVPFCDLNLLMKGYKKYPSVNIYVF